MLEFYALATSKVIPGQVLTWETVHSCFVCSRVNCTVIIGLVYITGCACAGWEGSHLLSLLTGNAVYPLVRLRPRLHCIALVRPHSDSVTRLIAKWM